MLLTAEGARRAADRHDDGARRLHRVGALAAGRARQRTSSSFVAKSGTFYTPTLLVAYGGPWGEQYFWQTHNPHDDAKLNRFTPHVVLDADGAPPPVDLAGRVPLPDRGARAPREVAARRRQRLARRARAAPGPRRRTGSSGRWPARAGPPKGSAMTPMEALRASTILAADKLGFAPDLGSIEAGKLADLVVLDADPLDDIHNTEKIRWVVKNGEVWEAETMKKLWPREEPPPTFFLEARRGAAPKRQ